VSQGTGSGGGQAPALGTRRDISNGAGAVLPAFSLAQGPRAGQSLADAVENRCNLVLSGTAWLMLTSGCPSDGGLRAGLDYQIVERLCSLEAKLESLIVLSGSKLEAEWIDRKSARTLLNVSDRHLYDLIADGTIGSDAIRNVGTVKKPRYRFHRTLLLNQYHRRA
jgi:hypothetical protein